MKNHSNKIMIPTQKICTLCKIEKSASAFRPIKRIVKGKVFYYLDSQCLDCIRAYHRKKVRTNPQKKWSEFSESEKSKSLKSCRESYYRKKMKENPEWILKIYKKRI